MSTFAETEIVNYPLSFAVQGKQNFRLPFPFTANKRKFAVSISVCIKQTEVAVFR
jgi:hypothetical protein